MLNYLVRRVLYAFPILVGVSLLTFLLFYGVYTPEQMARKNLSAKNPSPAQIKEWQVEHGYDLPREQQFSKHMNELFRLKFGRSDSTGEDIWGRIRAGSGPSAVIGGLIFVSALLAQVALALYTALLRGTYVDTSTTLFCVLLMSIPYPVVILAGQYFLGKQLELGPMAGYQPGFDASRFVLIPVLLGAVAGLGSGTRFYRTVMLEEVGQDYVRTARAKGVKESAILFRHVLKNAAIPIITSTVLAIPALILGSLLLESFFGIPGLGGYLFDAINSQDFAVVRAMVFLGTIMFIVGQIATDVGYALVDPRVRLP